MTTEKVTFLFALFLCSSLVYGTVNDNIKKTSETKDESVSNEKFVPSSSWQKVKEGQAIPRGMHVRMNINTGETEAKLLDPVERHSSVNQKTELIKVSDSEESSSEDFVKDVPYMTKQDLKHFLEKTIVSEEEENKDEIQDEEKVKQKYRSYSELKKEFGDLNLAVKTEAELLAELISSGKEKLMQSVGQEGITNVFTDLEYLVHHIDNAQEFIRLGGLTNIILPALNSSVARVRSEALWLLGSATQSNPKVQIAVLNAGVIQQLLRAAALDSDDDVRSRAVYALSCLTRRFPSAQAKLVEEGGLSLLGKMFDSEHFADSKTRMKILTLLNDFIQERQDAKIEIESLDRIDLSSNNNLSEIEDKIKKHKYGELREKHRQYETINLEKRLQEEGWCYRLPKILSRLQKNEANADRSQRRNDLGSVFSDNVPYRPEHDDVEKVLNSMLTMSHICMNLFSSDSDLKHDLKQLLLWYQELSLREEVIQKQYGQCDFSDSCEHNEGQEHDFYYTNMARTLNHLLKLLETSGDGAHMRKVEL